MSTGNQAHPDRDASDPGKDDAPPAAAAPVAAGRKESRLTPDSGESTSETGSPEHASDDA